MELGGRGGLAIGDRPAASSYKVERVLSLHTQDTFHFVDSVSGKVLP